MATKPLDLDALDLSLWANEVGRRWWRWLRRRRILAAVASPLRWAGRLLGRERAA